MSVMILGGSGFIGSKVVNLLASNGIEALSYDIIHSSVISNKAKWIRADILELSSIERIFYEYEIDTLIHLVGLPLIGYCEKNPHFSFLLNVMSLQNAIEAMRKTDVKKIIFASSASVYGTHSEKPLSETDPVNPQNIYGYHKFIAEQTLKSYCASYGINYVIFRLFNVYGGNPYTRKDVISIFIRRALNREPITVKGPNKFRDFIHVEDVAQVFLKAVTSDVANMLLNIGSGVSVTLGRLAEITKQCFPHVKIIEEETPDDGTGLQANVTLAKQLFAFTPRDPEDRMFRHMTSYAKHADSSH